MWTAVYNDYVVRSITTKGTTRWARIAQSAERLTCNQENVGSMPAPSSNHPVVTFDILAETRQGKRSL